MAMATSPPSSPPVSPPGLLQSSSSSTADPPNNEPQLSPHTPPRGRSRYPSSLAHGGPRVPLHRRGTSKTYERLEDLLQEAGYKETRVFTPETERHREYERGQGERRQMDGRVRSGMDTVVGFLAGLVLGQADSQRVGAEDSQNDQMVRVSPSAHQPRPLSRNGPIITASLLQTRGPPSQSLRSDGVTYNERSSTVHPSPARAYLRHIASAPNIPRRRLPREHGPPPVIKKSTASLKDGLNAQGLLPPMPPSWLETVTRAVLGFHGAQIQRNDTACSPRQSGFEPPASRSSTVRGYGRSTRKCQAAVLGDTAARQRGRSTPSLLTSPVLLQPPTMLAARSQASLGEVIKMNVVCRSAPASRSSSVARRKPRDESPATASLGILSSGSVRGKSKALPSTSRIFRRKTGRNHVDYGPSLRVRVEDDGSTFHIAGEREDYGSSSEDEDEDEVDLSKLLVHPRRQQSIKSLRHQLSKSHCRDNNASGMARTWAVRGDDDSALTPDDKGRIRRGSVNDGDWGAQVPPGSHRDNRTSHRRREIPVSWTQQGGGSGDELPGPPRHRER
ncbi:hypothetical protein BJY52DRAFT_1266915 [Lactarius psammicola]|nr:hypothetical protein BJY52DRAFT_1266915 [Lactarius psammicola]